MLLGTTLGCALGADDGKMLGAILGIDDGNKEGGNEGTADGEPLGSLLECQIRSALTNTLYHVYVTDYL